MPIVVVFFIRCGLRHNGLALFTESSRKMPSDTEILFGLENVERLAMPDNRMETMYSQCGRTNTTFQATQDAFIARKWFAVATLLDNGIVTTCSNKEIPATAKYASLTWQTCARALAWWKQDTGFHGKQQDADPGSLAAIESQAPVSQHGMNV